MGSVSRTGVLRLRVVLPRVVLFRAVVVLLRRLGAVPPSESDWVAGAAASLSRGAPAVVASTGDASSAEVCPPAAAADGLSGGCSGEVAGTSAGGASGAALAADFLLPAARLPGERRRGRTAFFSAGGDASVDCSADVVSPRGSCSVRGCSSSEEAVVADAISAGCVRRGSGNLGRRGSRSLRRRSFLSRLGGSLPCSRRRDSWKSAGGDGPLSFQPGKMVRWMVRPAVVSPGEWLLHLSQHARRGRFHVADGRSAG